MLGQGTWRLVSYSSITAPKVEQKVKVSSKTCLWHGWDLYLCIYHRVKALNKEKGEGLHRGLI